MYCRSLHRCSQLSTLILATGLLTPQRPFFQIPMNHGYLPENISSAYSSQTAMTTMDSPQRPQRSSIRHQLQLPVSLKLANRELYGQSENISRNGILISSALLIPEGSSVEMAVGIVRSRPGTFLSGRGKVVRVEPKGPGYFALAIKLDRDFELGQGSQLSPENNRIIASRRPQLALAWYTET